MGTVARMWAAVRPKQSMKHSMQARHESMWSMPSLWSCVAWSPRPRWCYLSRFCNLWQQEAQDQHKACGFPEICGIGGIQCYTQEHQEMHVSKGKGKVPCEGPTCKEKQAEQVQTLQAKSMPQDRRPCSRDLVPMQGQWVHTPNMDCPKIWPEDVLSQCLLDQACCRCQSGKVIPIGKKLEGQVQRQRQTFPSGLLWIPDQLHLQQPSYCTWVCHLHAYTCMSFLEGAIVFLWIGVFNSNNTHVHV